MPNHSPGKRSPAGPMRSSTATRQDESTGYQTLDEVEPFVSRYGLSHKRELFQKAALLLQNERDERQIPGITDAELKALDRETTHQWHQSRALYYTIFICALGAIEQGWSQTSMNGANAYIGDAFRLNTNSGTMGYTRLAQINCAIYFGNAFAGAWLSQPLNNLLGRRGAIFLGTAFCLAGNAGAGLLRSYNHSQNNPNAFPRPRWEDLLGFRIVLGVGLGINASTVSVFAAESAPAYIRGGLAVCWQMFVAFGILVGFLANAALYYVSRTYDFRVKLLWRLQLSAPIIPAIALFLWVFRCPESPFWHIKRSRYDRAFTSLCHLRNTELQAAYELYSTYLSRRKNEELSYHGFWSSILSIVENLIALFIVPRNRHALLASYTVMLSQQLCGINIIAFYSTTIFSGAGAPNSAIPTALWASTLFGLLNFLGAFPAVWTMDTFGRRRLLLWTLPAMAVTMGFASMSFSIPMGTNNIQLGILACVLYLFCILYSPGMGPVPCAYSAEVYPLSVREVGMSMAIATTNFWAMMLSLTFPILLNTMGQRNVFAMYAFFNVLAWALCWLFVRETKGINLEEMDAVFESSPITFIHERWAEVLDPPATENIRVGG